ncbi:MAG: GNAT family N-acetyltransferase [Planctomycetes bacterium]|nr:GNAT family N-acetyltransferase [Planctomycetota bacterium]
MTPHTAASASTIASLHHPQSLPAWLPLDALVAFLHHEMKPYQDTPEDIRRGILDALAPAPRGGGVHLAHRDGRLLGVVVMLRTGMAGYVPENLLLFAAVRGDLRGGGIGRELIAHAIAAVDGDVKLHVEPGNPALRLYQRLGFSAKYLDLRLTR